MVVAFDTWIFRSSHRYSGIYNYAKNLLASFRALACNGHNLRIGLFFDSRYSDRSIDLSASYGTARIETSFLRFHRLWQIGGLAAAAARIKADLIFSPTTHTCPFGPTPVVTTVHDVTPLTSPSFGVTANLLERIRLRSAAKLSLGCVTDSEYSKRDLVNVYGLSPEKVTVAYLGYDRTVFNEAPANFCKQQQLLSRFAIRSPYIFHHGAIQPRKNLLRLIRACGQLWNRSAENDFQLVLAGPLGWKYEPILAAASETGVPGRVVLTGPLADEDLAALLKGAALCVIPSLYEGFCLPMVECMACGIPTIASNASCLPEISGNVLHYFDPQEIDDIAAAIEKGLIDKALRSLLITRGLRRARMFSWELCAEQTFAALKECAAQLNA